MCSKSNKIDKTMYPSFYFLMPEYCSRKDSDSSGIIKNRYIVQNIILMKNLQIIVYGIILRKNVFSKKVFLRGYFFGYKWNVTFIPILEFLSTVILLDLNIVIYCRNYCRKYCSSNQGWSMAKIYDAKK